MRLPHGRLTGAVLTPLLTIVAVSTLSIVSTTSADAAGAAGVAGASGAAPAATGGPAAARASGKPPVGGCYQLTAKQLDKRSSSVDPIPCRRPHTSVTAGVPNLPAELSYRSSERAIVAGSVRVCAKPFAKTVGGTYTQRATARYSVRFFRPTRAQIGAGARWVRCDVVLQQGEGVGPLPSVRQPFLERGVTDRIRRCGTRSLTYVPCRGGHGYRGVGAFKVARKQYPTQQEFKDLLERGCRPFLGRSPGYATIRNQELWNTGDRTITCFKQTKS